MIQGSEGPIIVSPGEFVYTHNGVTLSIQVRQILDMEMILGVVKEGDIWVLSESLEGRFDLVKDDVYSWFNTVLVPRINTWLARLFGEKEKTRPEIIEALLKDLVVQINAKGIPYVE